MHDPSPAQEAAIRDAYARATSAGWVRRELRLAQIYRHWEDEEFGIPPWFSQYQFRVGLSAVELWCLTESDGEGLATHRMHAEGEHPKRHIIVAPSDVAAFNAAGWQTLSETRWSDADALIRGLAALASIQLRVLRPNDLPGWAKWPWPALVDQALLADRIVDCRDEPTGRILVTQRGARTHRLLVTPQDEQLVRWWHETKPELGVLQENSLRV